MKQAMMISPGVIEFRDVDVPTPGPDQLLVRVRRIGVCGSDIHVNKGLHPFTSYPVVQGHEWSGTIEALGSGVEASGDEPLAIGVKVTATPQIVCGVCKPCCRGDYNICDSLAVQGFQAPGVAQEFFVAERSKVVCLPEAFTLEQGAMVEPVAVAVHSTSRGAMLVGGLDGHNVVVAGAGPIGNLVAQVCRARGAKVLITDTSDFRLDVAKKCGIQHTANPRQESLTEAAQRVFDDDGFNVAFECAGVQLALDSLVDTIEKGSVIVAVAVYEEKPRIDMSVVGDREHILVGTLMYKREDYLEAVRLMEAGLVVTQPLESQHFPFGQYAGAYRFIDEQGERSMKVFIDL